VDPQHRRHVRQAGARLAAVMQQAQEARREVVVCGCLVCVVFKMGVWWVKDRSSVLTFDQSTPTHTTAQPLFSRQ